jgi:hypothetical protein
MNEASAWPELPLAAWSETCDTLHLWTQIVGKVRLASTLLVNHWWNVTLYVTPRGLATSPICHGERAFEIAFDFIDHRLVIATDDGRIETLALAPMAVADFYSTFMDRLRRLGIEVHIWTMPSEIKNAVPFEQDWTHAHYDPAYAQRFWRALLQADRVMKVFRARFIGKVSPVHFFWGSFDLAVTRFSGRRAPRHPGGVPHLSDDVAAEAYSHEVSSAGFWPGGGAIDYPAFYSYAYPVPDGFAAASVRPDAAFFSKELGEFILPYDAVRSAAQPDEALLEFLQSTYEAAANAAKWDRDALECGMGRAGVPRKLG